MSGPRCANLFGLVGGPAAWFLQLCAGYALASSPCFHDGERLTAPIASLQWTWTAMVAAMIAGVAVSLAALIVSWGTYHRSAPQSAVSSHEVVDSGAGRAQFLALWGIVLGAGFTLATAITAVAFAILPRCAG